MSRGSWAIELNTRREIPYLRALFILIEKRKGTALSTKSPHYSFLCPVEIRTNFSSQKLLLIADGFSEHNRLEISALESKCVEHNNDAFSSTVECYESYESAENWLIGFAVMLFDVIDSFGPPVWLIRSV